jgi:hypothetical protein
MPPKRPYTLHPTPRLRLVTGSDEGVRLGDRSLGLGPDLERGLLALVVRLTLDPLLLEPVDDVPVAPADLVRDALEGAVLPAGLEAEHTESRGHDHLLDLVLGRGHTLEERQALERGGTTGGLVGDHTADGLEQDPGRSTVVEGTRLLGVDNVAFCGVSGVRSCRASHIEEEV